MRQEFQGESSYIVLDAVINRCFANSHRQRQIQVTRRLEFLAAAGRQISRQAPEEVHG